MNSLHFNYHRSWGLHCQPSSQWSSKSSSYCLLSWTTPSTGYPRLGSLQVDVEMGVFNGAQHLWEETWLGKEGTKFACMLSKALANLPESSEACMAHQNCPLLGWNVQASVMSHWAWTPLGRACSWSRWCSGAEADTEGPVIWSCLLTAHPVAEATSLSLIGNLGEASACPPYCWNVIPHFFPSSVHVLFF